MRVLEVSGPGELKQLMRQIGVDPCGIRIMAPKAFIRLVWIPGLSNIAANIIKQEMLSLGADAAVARGSLTGRVKTTDCLLIGNLSQLRRLSAKLACQPFGLKGLSRELSCTLEDYAGSNAEFKAGDFVLHLNRRPQIMGVINLTPDSFSGDGFYRFGRLAPAVAADYSENLIRDGADIIDIGGESSRPGARPVSLKEELARVIPVIKLLARRKIRVPVSVDTYKAEVARQALDYGAAIVNDITALSDKHMAATARRYGAAVILMHMQGRPFNMQKKPQYRSLMDEITTYLGRARDKALQEGIPRQSIAVDPGIGFGKTLEHNLQILKRLREFSVLGQPVLVGTSRKAFLGGITKAAPQERIFGTVASSILAVKNGARIVRVHDVKAVKQSLAVLAAIEKA